MGSLRRATVPAFLALEVGFKLALVRAFGNAFAPSGDHAAVTRLFFESALPVSAIWVTALLGLAGRIERLRQGDSIASRGRAVASLRRLPNHLALAWCANWCATVVVVGLRVGTLVSPPAAFCLLLTVATGSLVVSHTLTSWLIEAHLRDAVREQDTPGAPATRSLGLRLAAYGAGLCFAPALYVASLAFSVPFQRMSSGELAAELLIQACVVAAFATVSAVLLSLSFVGPIRRMATIMQTLARGAEAARVERMPLLQDDELGTLSESTNHMLDRLEHSDRDRLALQATLEHRVEERTAALLEATEQIAREFGVRGRIEHELRQAQRLEVVGRLAAGIAHEINTPIQYVSDSLTFVRAGIDDLTQLLARDGALIAKVVAGEQAHALAIAAVAAADDADLPYLREQLPLALDRALEGLARVATIIRSMGRYAHPDRSEMIASDLNTAIMSTLTIARNEYKYIAELDTDFGELPPVTCYIGDFNQVILNLVVNAAHAIGDVVGTSGVKGRLMIKTWRDDGDAVIAISDTGGGIPEHVLDHIFEPFFTTKDVGKGTGQGLAIARGVIVERHHGSLTCESVDGYGTTFLIRIPIAGTAAAQRAADEPAVDRFDAPALLAALSRSA